MEASDRKVIGSSLVWSLVLCAVACAFMLAIGCGSSPASRSGGVGNGAGGEGGGVGPSSLYAVSSSIFGTNETTSYVSLIDSLGAQTLDDTQAREFPGLADLWVYDGAVFVTDKDAQTITRFGVSGHALVKQATLSFMGYGTTDFGFWRNKFVSPSKAYFLNGASQYIVWDPSKMEIVGTLSLPAIPDRGALKAFPGYADRAAVLRGNRLYQPFYFTDDTYFAYAPASLLVVVDVERDQVAATLELPCPGIDHASEDELGNMYFSSWIFAPGAAALLAQPKTCVAKVSPSDSAPSVLFSAADVTAGHEGGVFRYLGNGHGLLSVLETSHATSTDAPTVTYGANWRFWDCDIAKGSATPVDELGWSAGAAYAANLDRPVMLVPAGDYAATTVYGLENPHAPQRLLETRGWSTRLFEVAP
jgi:hypothetical protein